MFSTPARRGALLAMLAALSMALLLLSLYALLSSRELAQRNGELLRTVKNCTTPGKACHDRSVKETARAVADINRVTVAAAACADQGDTQTSAEIRRCVVRRLAH